MALGQHAFVGAGGHSIEGGAEPRRAEQLSSPARSTGIIPGGKPLRLALNACLLWFGLFVLHRLFSSPPTLPVSALLLCSSALSCFRVPDLCRLSSSAMLKKLQRSIATLVHDNGHHTVDASFDQAKQNWQRMGNVLQEVRKQIVEHQEAMIRMVQSSYGATEALAALYPQATVSLASSGADGTKTPSSPAVTTAVHPYCALAHASKHTLFQLQHDRLDSCTRRLGATCLANCTELLDKFAALRTRVNEREEALKELDYYENKTLDLRKELNKTTAAGKREQPKDEERRLRNEETLARMKISFEASNRQLTQELSSYWTRRLDLLAPILLDFFKGSSNFLQEMTEAHADIKMAQRGLPPIEFATVLFEVVSPQVAAQTAAASSAAGAAGATSTAASTTPPSSAVRSPDLPPPLPAGVSSNGTRAVRVQSAGANAGSPPPPPPTIVAAAAAALASASASPPPPNPRAHLRHSGGINNTSPPSFSSPYSSSVSVSGSASASSATPPPPLPSPSSSGGGGSSFGSSGGGGSGSASAPPPRLPPRKPAQMERPLPPPPQSALTKPVVPGSSGGGGGGNSNGSPASSNGPPPPLPPPIPSAAALAASASASYSNGTIPVSLYSHSPQPPQPPPPPPSLRTSSGNSSSSGSATPSASPHASVGALCAMVPPSSSQQSFAQGSPAASPGSQAHPHSHSFALSPERTEEFEDRYESAVEGLDQPSFVAASVRSGPPPLPPTNADPEPFPRAAAFADMHRTVRSELEAYKAETEDHNHNA